MESFEEKDLDLVKSELDFGSGSEQKPKPDEFDYDLDFAFSCCRKALEIVEEKRGKRLQSKPKSERERRVFSERRDEFERFIFKSLKSEPDLRKFCCRNLMKIFKEKDFGSEQKPKSDEEWRSAFFDWLRLKSEYGFVSDTKSKKERRIFLEWLKVGLKSEQKPKSEREEEESDFFKKLKWESSSKRYAFQKGGGIHYLTITSIDQLSTLINLSNHALKTYNQNNNQGPTFMFHQFVQSTFSICRRYSNITFQAKAEGVPSNSPAAITTFQANVEISLTGHRPPTVHKCAITI